LGYRVPEQKTYSMLGLGEFRFVLIYQRLPPILDFVDMSVEMRPGRFSDRFVAYLVDSVPFTIAAVGGVWAWGGPFGRPLTDQALWGIGAASFGAAVLWQFAGNLSGATLGKQVMGLRVVCADGTTPGFGRSLVRALGWVLSTPLANFGFWLALLHPQTRALHDLVAGTYVVETGPRRSNGALAFLFAAAAAIGLFVLQYWTNLLRPTSQDVAAVTRAREGLEVVAKIQEVYRARHGAYAETVQDLAEASGDVALFRSAMLDVFSPSPFSISAGNRRWRVTAAAKDRRRTLVRREGP
jgi:uncharacterized RDD family membrane protein YckC